MSRKQLGATALLMAGWMTAVVGGFAVMANYGSIPGARAASLAQLERDEILTGESSRPTLVMFVHPHCPCSRASLAEFEKVLAQSGSAWRAVVVLVLPDGVPESWRETALRKRAEAIADVAIVIDAGGRLGDKYGARTSGHVLLFDAAGQVRFSGGITASRGQEGESAGQAALLRILKGDATDAQESPVYGCPLLGTSSNCDGKGATCRGN